MIRCLVAAFAASVVFGASAAVKVGENLLLNGRFMADQAETPPHWIFGAGFEMFEFRNSGGPEGKPSAKISPCSGMSLYQFGFAFPSNGLYEISFSCRCTDVEAERFDLGMVASNWQTDSLQRLEKGTYGWKRVTARLRAPYYAPANVHGLVLYLRKFTKGTIEVADFSLAAADEETAKKTDPSSLVTAAREIRLVPLAPRLDEVSRAKSEVAFRFFGALPEGTSERDVSFRFSFAADTAATRTVPFARETFRVAVPTTGVSGQVTAEVTGKGGATLFSRTFDYSFRPEIKTSRPERTLNNFVTEIVRERVPVGTSRFSFSGLHRAWYYVSAPGTAELDGKAILPSVGGKSVETFRELAAGDHELVVTAADGGEVIVRRTTENFMYPFCYSSYVSGNGAYDITNHYRHLWGGFTTFNGNEAYRTPEAIAAAVRDGRLVLLNLTSRSLADADDLLRRIKRCNGFNKPFCGGVTADEQYLYQSGIMDNFAKSCWRLHSPDGRRLYNWVVGAPAVDGVDHDLLSASVNANGGTGKVLYELYCETHPTEQAARAAVADRAHEYLAKFRAFCPNIDRRFGLILGCFSQLPTISLWHHPQVDYKYFLDLQWNILANDPDFAQLGTVGYWGMHDMDEDVFRWAAVLVRHYAVEGKKTMLSEKYGYRYLPGHLTDGDFEDGFGAWVPSGGVTVDRERDISRKCEGRWGKARLGDNFVRFTGFEPGRRQAISQTAKGLVPGRRYLLLFPSLDVKTYRAGKEIGARDARDLGVKVDLGAGAELVREKSWRYQKDKWWTNAGQPTYLNCDRLVFTALKNETLITLSNDGVAAGDEIGVNFISLTPFYDE